MKRKISRILLLVVSILALITVTTFAYEQNGLLLGLRSALTLGEGEETGNEQEDPAAEEVIYSITIGEISLEYANLPDNVSQTVTIPITTEGIPDNSTISLKLVKDGLDIEETEYSMSGNVVTNNSASIVLNLGNELPMGEYYLEVSYVEVISQETKATNNVKFTVSTMEVKSIEIEDTALYMDKGETMIITYNVVPNAIQDSDLIFESENESIAIIAPGGLVTAIGRGETIVKILSSDRTIVATCNVIVTEATIEITEFTTIPETLAQGEEQEINIKVHTEDFEIGSVLDVIVQKNGNNVTSLFDITGDRKSVV